jgi:hypothetical protein
MRKAETHFEQVPLELVKKIARQDLPDDRANRKECAVTPTPAGKIPPHRSPALRKKLKEHRFMEPPESKINCSICNKPVSLETAKTDEFGRAVHQECYLFKVGINPSRDSVPGPGQCRA